MCPRILVPYDHPFQLQAQLSQAVPLATRLAAELVLLRVNLPLNAETGAVDWEQLFSEMKSLRAQLPAGSIHIVMESGPGEAEQAIFDYAEQNDVSLILSPHLTVSRTQAAA